MAKVEDYELVDPILLVLDRAATGRSRGTARGFLTAYQIFNRFEPDLQARLRREYGPKSGKRAGQNFSPASRVAQVAAGLRRKGVTQEYFDTGGLQFDVSQSAGVEAGYGLCAIFRRKRGRARR